MAEIFLLELNNELNEGVFGFLLNFCSFEKKNMILKKKCKADKDRSAVGNALAKYAIKTVFKIPVKNQEFYYGKNSKPYLLDYENIHFSISHSENIVVCAVSDKAVGIDVQKKKNYSNRLAELLSAKTDDEFFSAWTKKEAEFKRRGEGKLLKSLKFSDVSNVKTFRYKDYYISISEKNKEV